MQNAKFKMQITEPHKITREMHIFSCDLAWFGNSHFKFSILHFALHI